MPRILCLTGGLTGMLYSSLELARRLAAAGHEVTYGSFPIARQTVEGVGMPFLPLEPSRLPDFLAADGDRNSLDRLRGLRHRRFEAMSALEVGDLADQLCQVDPELLLIDAEMLEHVVVASSTGVPIALLNTFCSIWRQPGVPPPHHLAIPGRGWRGSRLGSWLLWQNLGLKKTRRAWLQKIRHVGCDRVSVLRQLSRQTGFDLSRAADFKQWPIPFTFDTFPFISLHALEFELHPEPPTGVHYVGPMLLEHRARDPRDQEALARVEALVQRRLGGGGQRRMLYAGFGSAFTTDLSLVRRLVEAVASRPDWDLLVSLGGQRPADELGSLPANVHMFHWLPQVAALKSCDVVVTHGGINTIDEAVLAGAPLLIYCGFETDMGGNAARVQHHGLGIVGDRHRDTGQIIAGHIDRLLTEPHFGENVQNMRNHYLDYAAHQVAEQVVESLLSGAATERTSGKARG